MMMEMNEKKRIAELPKHVADKIAAGEVVDRPVSIVKELVENSIDAGASSIIVEIKNGGKTYIRVTDNGCGIEKEDVGLAFKRHATSKIRSVTDLDHIGSLGFRGEALASISAVSRVELITKTAEDKSGIRIKIEGGEVLEKVDTGCPDGTTVIIEDLFFNTPARLKFMKPDAAESTLIIDFISKMALAYPQIKIRLINNGNILFSTAGKGDIYTNILTIFSKETGEKLIRFREEDGGMTLDGFVSAPNNSKTNRKSQIFFVNGRSISSKLMENAVSEAYHEKLFEGRYPIAFLFLQVSPEKLDVNVHPNKREVRFDEEQPVKEFIAESIRNSLKTKDAIPEISSKNLFKFQRSDDYIAMPDEGSGKPSWPVTKSGTPGEKSETPGVKNKTEEQVDIKKLLSEQRMQVAESEEQYRSAEKTQFNLSEATRANLEFDMRELTVTGSIFGTYITAVDDSSFYLIDQHAAHERIFYEKLLAQHRNEEQAQQLLLTPVVVNVSHAVKNDSGEMLDFLGNYGFTVEEFGPTAYLLKAIPLFMDLNEAGDFLDFILENIAESADLKNQKKIGAMITNACKKAVKAHDVLEKQEIERLMADLAKTSNPFSCPHGRPTFVRLKKYEIEKMFKRV